MKKSFGTKLRELRGKQTQAATAAIFGIAQQTYSGWEKDQRNPSLTELCSICSHYAVSADWLLGLSDKKQDSDCNIEIEKKFQIAQQKLARVNKALGFILKGANELQSIIEDGEETTWKKH